MLVTFAHNDNGNGSNIAYRDNLKCMKCIKGGYNFCHQGNYGQAVPQSGLDPNAICCENGQCDEAQDTSFHCSYEFENWQYAKSMCS